MEAITTQRQRHFNTAERSEWVALYHSSQLPQEQFVQQHGLRLGTLQRWLREERERNSSSAEAPVFQEVHLPSVLPTRGWVAEILLPNGVVVRLGANALPSWMPSLLQTLRKTC
jgi:transposase-like protein